MSKAVLLARISAALLIITGSTVLVGWEIDHAILVRLSPGLAPMMPNTAVGFIVYGLALFLLSLKGTTLIRRLIVIIGVFISLLGLITALEYVFNFSIGIDELLYIDYENPQYYPGRMSMLTAISFFLAGVCLLLESSGSINWKSSQQYLMLAVLLVAFFSLTGIIFGAAHFISHITTMALHTTLGFILLAVSRLCLNSRDGWVAIFSSHNLAGLLMRRTLIPLFILYPIVAFVRVLGEDAGYYNTAGGTVFMMVTSLALFIVIIILTAQTVNKLDREKDQYKKFFELSSELLVIANTDGFIKKASSSFTKALHYSESEILSTPLLKFVDPADVTTVEEELAKLAKGIPLVAFQVRLKTKKGETRDFIWSCTPDASTGELFAAGYDITELKEARQVRAMAEKLNVQNKQLASFAHIISHNLRSPVNNLTALLKLHQTAKPEEQAEFFDKFEKVSQHLSTTLDDLSESLRIKEEIDKDREHLQFEDVLIKTKEILTGQILESKVIITHEFKNASTIEYPRIYLESIFLNLLSNAIKYRSPKRGLRIHVETRLQDKSLILWIEDNGQGIDLNRYGEHLFGFYKSFHSQKDSKGVGLFLTKTQVEAMGGTISVQSEVDKGSIFKINFLVD
jgi:PAS domain S-box-containing protein